MNSIKTKVSCDIGDAMRKKIAVGGENFINLRKSDSYYVDKTELLYDLFEKSNNAVTLFTRPRRFGKTLTMSMIESFFSIDQKDDRQVFDGLSITRHKTFCDEYMNQYPVLFISLKDVEGRNFDLAYDKLKTVIADFCKKHTELENDPAVDRADSEIFHRLLYKTADEAEIQNSLKTIMRMMNATYGKPVILLIDEYDVPLAKANANGFYREMLDVIRGLMSTSLKTNDYLKFAVITGCLRIPKESIFTGVNNFASYSVLDDRFSQYFGFTANEVDQLLSDFHLSDKAGTIREWYDGYLFGKTNVYCPWDVVNYVSDLLYDPETPPQNYWENTSGNDAIQAFFDMPDINVSDKFETLLNGGTIYQTVTNALTYDQAYESEDNLWSILLMTGYVTVAKTGLQRASCKQVSGQVDLKIPNREISNIFQTAVVDHFKQSVDQTKIRELMQALWNGEPEKASQILSDLLWNTISYMDYSEDYYHAFLTGIFVGRGGYSVQSNKEQGLGRPDIDLRDRPNRRAIIIEAKRAESEERMSYWCDAALEQIESKGYAKGLNGYRKVLRYGIAFFQKDAMVKEG